MQRDIGGRFQPLVHSSQGAMGSVYRARDLQTGNVVALKVLTLDRPFDLVRFGREATLLAKVHHPNVVDYVTHGDAPFRWFPLPLAPRTASPRRPGLSGHRDPRANRTQRHPFVRFVDTGAMQPWHLPRPP